MVQEIVEIGIIRACKSSFSSLVVMVYRNDCSWSLCLKYRDINNITINDIFSIPIIDELFNSLGGEFFLIVLDPHPNYYQIIMLMNKFPKYPLN